MKLLLVEDDVKLVELLSGNLKEQGFLVSYAVAINQLFDFFNSDINFDIIVLDRLLQSIDTRDLIGQIKKKWPQAPILVLSAISTPNEKAELLNKGVDDYMGKPFSTQELIARIKALLRRTQQQPSTYVQIGNLVLDTITRTITVDGKADVLPTKEFLLLRVLSQDHKRIWSKTELLDYVWGQSSELETNVVESTMANLRKRIVDLKANITIRNMRNAGYWIES
jgi:DNA-binding response OmpR family regulator